MGFEVLVETSAGDGVFRSDDEYRAAGAKIADSAAQVFAEADVVLKVKQPWFNEAEGKHEVEMMRDGITLITFLHPAAPPNHDMIKMLAKKQIIGLTMDGIPRTSRAQQMDALTSMSTVTGYKSVLMGANMLPKFIPMIGTAIGTIKPAKFLVIGVGVVGLQAIATAKRLGATVMAVDIRDDARKAADSLGAKVVGFDVPPEMVFGADGDVEALSEEWLEKERGHLEPLMEDVDVIVLSALVPGEIAPVLITEEMMRRMKPGSAIIDVSIDQGGNCEATEGGRICTRQQVHVCGLWNIPGSMPVHSTWLYANNLFHYVKNLYKNGITSPDFDDEIVKHTLVTQKGDIVHEGALKALSKA